MSEVASSTKASATAPSDLPEGYLLDVEVGGETKQIAVPEGGVTSSTQFEGEIVKVRLCVVTVGRWGWLHSGA